MVKKFKIMYVEQMYTDCLAEAAYYIESEGECVIIDPLREWEPYVEKAKERGAQIKYIFETHFHADFVSGHVDLAAKTGAKIVYGPGAQAGFDMHEATDGEIFEIGKVKIKVLHTPGHTPESSTYLLLDENEKEHAIFTGDTLFIDDVGRPDLAVKSDLTKEDLAALLYNSLQTKILPLPDDVIVYPGHGKGSACGKNMSSNKSDTLGQQKITNYALRCETKEKFVEQVTANIPPPPQYFPKNAMLNKHGYDNVDEVIAKGTRSLSVEDFEAEMKNGATVLDTRKMESFAEGYVPGSIFIGLDGLFATWVGTLIQDIKQPMILITDKGDEIEAVLRLARVGYDNCLGTLSGGFEAWTDAGKSTAAIESISATEMKNKIEAGSAVVDVRKPSEFEVSHIGTATSYPLDYINGNLNTLDKDAPVYLHCQTGYRSVIAISILRNQGYNNLVNVSGGMDALMDAGVQLTSGVPAE